MGNLKLTSSYFSDGGEIPRKCGYKWGNVSPSLVIDGIPDGTKTFTLIMDDPDAMEPAGKIWVHWVFWNYNISGATTRTMKVDPDDDKLVGLIIEEGVSPQNTEEKKLLGAMAVEGMTDFGEVGYGGPAPPDKRHTYVFKLYALDTKLDLPDKSTKADVEKAMKGHIIEQTQLTGTYAP